MTSNNRLAIMVFLVILLLPFLGHLLTASTSKDAFTAENRQITKAPKLSLLFESPKTYVGELDGYIQDHFGFRDRLISLAKKSRSLIVGLRTNDKVFKGKEGWLFYSQTQLKHTQSLMPATSQFNQNWLQAINAIKAQTEKYGGKFYILVAPDKSQVYSEFLPDNIIYQREHRRSDSFARVAKKEGLIYLDMLDQFLAEKDSTQLYYKTDTHWTYDASYLAYRELMQAMNQVVVQPEHLFRKKHVLEIGDLSRMLGKEKQVSEQIEYNAVNHQLPSVQSLKAKRLKERQHLLVIGDSFYHHLKQYLQISFQHVSFVHNNHGRVILNQIDRKKPDYVVLQFVERKLEVPFNVTTYIKQ